MKIKDLISILQQHQNQDAEIQVIANTAHNKGENSDFECVLPAFKPDVFYDDCIELFVYPKEEIKTPRQYIEIKKYKTVKRFIDLRKNISNSLRLN
jgi:hypothetical protein